MTEGELRVLVVEDEPLVAMLAEEMLTDLGHRAAAIKHGLREEIRRYSEALFEKPHVVVLTKRDLLPAETEVPAVNAPEARGVLTVSSAARSGLEDLKEELWSFVQTEKEAAPAPDELAAPEDEPPLEEDDYVDE